MKRAAYAKHLRDMGLELIGQDVFHIIANSKGGADHPANFLYALGSGFNRTIGDGFDDLNAFLAGPEKTAEAVRVSMELGNVLDPRGKAVVKYKPRSSSSDPMDEAKWLVQQGKALINTLRLQRRNEKKAAES